MKTVLAIDPGPIQSAFVIWNGINVGHAEILPNDALRFQLRTKWSGIDIWACEMVACYGMPVGAEVFETCLQIGRFQEIRSLQECNPPYLKLVYRREVKMNLCGTMKAKDPNIRRALIDKYGVVGTKKHPGPLFGVSSHLWAALGVAVTVNELAP